MTKVSKITGVPQSTLSNWKKTEWWEHLEAEARSQTEEEIRSNNLAINGDHHLGRDGELVRVPVKARDLSVVSGIAHDKATGVTRLSPMSRGNTEEALKALAEQFKQLAGEKPIPGEVVENMKLNRGFST